MKRARYNSKQQLIEEAAYLVFTEEGLDHLTLEAVAEKLGYTKQSIYYYYKNKEDLVSSLFYRIVKETRKDFDAIFSTEADAETIMIRFISFYVEGSCERKGFFALHHDVKKIMDVISDAQKKAEMFSMMKDIPQKITDLISKGIIDGLFKKEDPEALAGTIFALLSGVTSITGIPSLQRLSVDRKAELICNLILKGIKND